MVINQTTTSIVIVPFVVLPSVPTAMTLEVMHKETKVKVTSTITPTYNNSEATFSLPSLTAISNVANQGDELIVEISLSGVRYYQALAYWIVGAYDMYHSWKSWTTTPNQSNQFITL